MAKMTNMQTVEIIIITKAFVGFKKILSCHLQKKLNILKYSKNL
jgi:hypothetical protein